MPHLVYKLIHRKQTPENDK